MKLRIATRKSALALWQTRWVAERLQSVQSDLRVEEVHVVTTGDRVVDRPLREIGGKSLFVGDVEQKIVDDEADIAVHSLKDVPAENELADGCALVSIPVRADARDVLLTRDGRDLDELAAGNKIGTTSLRRVSQLRAHRPDLNFVNLRGNVDTRLRKLDDGEYDGIVLAVAGVSRLGLLDRPHAILPTELCLPAVGQGALAIEARANSPLLSLLKRIEDARTRVEVEAERMMLLVLEGSCHVPIAGHAQFDEASGRLSLEGMVASVHGDERLTGAADHYVRERSEEARIEAARSLGREVAEGLLARGAKRLIQQADLAAAHHEHRGNGGRSGKWGSL